MGALKNVPTLRFPTFKSSWKEKKTAEIFERVVNAVNVEKTKEYQELGIRSHGKGIFHKKPNLGVTIGNKRVFWVKENTFIVNIVFAWEQAVAKTTNKEKGLIASHRFPMYEPIENILDLDFILYFFLRKKGKHILELASPGGAGRNKTLGQKEFANTKIVIPNIEEQKKIASFITSTNERIKLLKKKKETLEEYKKGIVQKIFNQEIRFKSKNGTDFPEWDEKMLGEIGKFQTSSVDKLTVEGEKNIFLVNYLDVYKHKEINNKTIKDYQIVSAKDSQIKSSNLKRGDILFTPSSEKPSDIGHSVVIFEDIKNAVYSYHLMRFRPDIKLDLNYAHYFCNTPSVLKQMSKFATGSTRYTISVGNFSKIKVSIPNKEEQIKIAEFLSKIDSAIRSMAKQIEKSEAFKKGLFQKMFV